jgi:hypothetical protein
MYIPCFTAADLVTLVMMRAEAASNGASQAGSHAHGPLNQSIIVPKLHGFQSSQLLLTGPYMNGPAACCIDSQHGHVCSPGPWALQNDNDPSQLLESMSPWLAAASTVEFAQRATLMVVACIILSVLTQLLLNGQKVLAWRETKLKARDSPVGTVHEPGAAAAEGVGPSTVQLGAIARWTSSSRAGHWLFGPIMMSEICQVSVDTSVWGMSSPATCKAISSSFSRFSAASAKIRISDACIPCDTCPFSLMGSVALLLCCIVSLLVQGGALLKSH